MTKKEVENVLTKAGFSRWEPGLPGFMVIMMSDWVMVTWKTPKSDPGRRVRMLKAYETALSGHNVQRLRSHLVIR